MSIEYKINKLAEVIQSSSMTSKEKGISIDILKEIVSYANIKERDLLKARAYNFDFPKVEVFNDYLNKLHGIISIIYGSTGPLKIDFLSEDSFQFIMENRKGLKQPITLESIEFLCSFYDYFVLCENKKPKNIQELREYFPILKQKLDD